jgi:tetratricopeptide (TPR) repeat protein
MSFRRTSSMLVVLALLVGAPARAKPMKGDAMPAFELDKVGGGKVSSAGLGDAGLTLVVFLAVDSKPSRDLASTLAGLVRKRGETGITVVGIAGDPAERLREFGQQQSVTFALCSDPGGDTVRRYGADQLVPITYVVAPGGTIAQVIPGGGEGPRAVVLAVADKELARGNVEVAGNLFGEVASQDPKNAEAHAGAGFALARQGKLERAEEEFKSASAVGGKGAELGTVGLAEIALRKGDLDTAASRAAKAGGTGYADVIRGEVALRRNQPDAAREAFQVATTKPGDFAWQKATAYNNLARVTATRGDGQGALDHYDQAVAAEPFMVEARSNKAVALEKAGRTGEAKKAFASAKAIAPNDQLVAVLMRRLEERDREKTDVERQKLTDKLVDDLVAAYKGNKPPPRPEDDWSPRALVVSFLDVQDRLGPLAPDGMAQAFVLELTSQLQRTGRVKVVDRELIDKVLAELKLASSDLTDPATRLKLGRVLGASVIGTGGFYPAGTGAQLQLRLIDTETTDIRDTLAQDLTRPREVTTLASQTAEHIARTLKAAYPLKGKIASVDGGEIIVGIGRKHGAEPGLRLAVTEDGAPVEVDGEVIGRRQRTIGRLQVERVEDGFAYARAIEGSGFAKGQHLQEVAP